jgi:pimeloyl-ACP methyl ester carboxylesterase
MDRMTNLLRIAIGCTALLAAPAFALDFSDCELKTAKAVSGMAARCAAFEVPENRAVPDGRRITLRVAKVPSRASTPLPDPIVFLAGGPGQSATESFPQVAPAYRQLLGQREVILVDQRGTGGSHPLKCPMPGLDDPTAPMPDREEIQQMARDCLASIDADVAHYTTRDYLADLEALRTELGIERWNIVGGSYGTRVALAYVQAHPDSLRSVVLDGVVPQDVALSQDHGRHLDEALAAQFKRCREDEACHAAFGDPWETLQELRVRYREAPTTVMVPDPRSRQPLETALTEETLALTARLYAYQPETAALLPLLLHQAREGDPQPLLAQARMIVASLDEMLAHGMQLSVTCSEDVPWLRANPDDTSLIGAAMVTFLQAQCEVWPVPRAPAAFKQPVDSDLPVLLLSGEFDPVTPPSYAERALATLGNARHLVAPGQGHIVQMRGCMPRLLTRFIRDASVAGLDAECVADMSAPGFYLNFNGSAP